MDGMILTNEGKRVLALAVLGQTLHFTRALLGDGELSDGQDPASLSTIISPKHELTFTGLRLTDQIGTAELTMEMHNQDVLEGFYVREYGLYATDPETGEDVLYAYCNKGEEAPYIAAFNGTDIIVFTLTFESIIGDAKTVTAEILQPQEYVSHSRFDQRMMDVMHLIDDMNGRVLSLTGAVLELTRTAVWDSANLVHQGRVLAELRRIGEANTRAVLEIGRNLVWDAVHTIRTEKRLEALEAQ